MKQPPTLPGGDLEYAVIGALWDLGCASVREVHVRVGEPAGLVYTTTAKVLDRLRSKGLVSRKRRGNTYTYRARVARGQVERTRAFHVVRRLLGREPRPAIANLVEAVESLDPELLKDLAEAVAARRKHRHGS